MKAKFIKDVPNARILRNRLDSEEGMEQQIFTERSVVLKYHNFINFREHLSSENEIVKNHLDDMFIDEQGIWHVIMVCSTSADIMLLVFNKGSKCPKYVAIKTNGGEQVEKRFTTCNRYQFFGIKIEAPIVIGWKSINLISL